MLDIITIYLTTTTTMSSNILYPPQLSRPPSSSSSHFIPGPTSSTLHSRANATPYTPPNGYAESPYGAAAASSSSSGTGYTRTAHELEGQNDERLEGLMGKVRMLKDVSGNVLTIWTITHG